MGSSNYIATANNYVIERKKSRFVTVKQTPTCCLKWGGY